MYCKPQNLAQLRAALYTARRNGAPYYLLGEGSNILFCDEGFDGIVLQLSDALKDICVKEDTITVGAGKKMAAVCIEAQRHALEGLAFAYGIPGSVGGAVYMNAGAYGGEMAHVLRSVTYMDEDGGLHIVPAAQLALGYRTSVFQGKPWCIVNATLRLRAGDAAAIQREMDDYMQRRRAKQPLDLPSAGSAFKRPQGAFAGALIDQCGLRGFRVGDAAISQKHCGFIVNLGNATCDEVLALAAQVAAVVKSKTGFTLEKEIRVVTTQSGH